MARMRESEGKVSRKRREDSQPDANPLARLGGCGTSQSREEEEEEDDEEEEQETKKKKKR